MRPVLDNIDDERERKVLELLPVGTCRCFDSDPLYDMHDVRPPCEAVRLARDIVKALT